MMSIAVIRVRRETDATIGHLFIDGVFTCFTLEDLEREEKIPEKTAIPGGKYRVKMDWSDHFQKVMPHVMDVPGFEGVRIHSGNTAKDTEGCILVGLTAIGNQIGQSRLAFEKVFKEIVSALTNKEEVWLEIIPTKLS